MYPVVEAGGVSYDVVCPSDYIIQKMAENGLLAELNYDNIPNIKNIDSQYLEKSESFDPGNRYAVPYTWGTVGILYNTKRIEELGVQPHPGGQICGIRPTRARFSCRTASGTLHGSSQSLGYSMNSTDEGELARQEIC